MDISTLFKKLDISKWSLVWSYITGGFSGLAKLICEAFSKLLKKADAEQLKHYSELAEKIAKFLRYGIELFITDEKVKAAADATAKAIEELAQHIKDGDYTEAELDSDVDNIEACIDAWKKIG